MSSKLGSEGSFNPSAGHTKNTAMNCERGDYTSTFCRIGSAYVQLNCILRIGCYTFFYFTVRVGSVLVHPAHLLHPQQRVTLRGRQRAAELTLLFNVERWRWWCGGSRETQRYLKYSIVSWMRLGYVHRSLGKAKRDKLQIFAEKLGWLEEGPFFSA